MKQSITVIQITKDTPHPPLLNLVSSIISLEIVSTCTRIIPLISIGSSIEEEFRIEK